jgi:type IV pilus assembly protein PilE
MVTIAIIGIIASIALPAYTSYVVRGKLAEVGGLLSDARLKQEQYYADNRNYGTAGGACGSTTSTGKYFTFVCVCAAAVAPSTTCQSYTITATSMAGKGMGAAGDYVYTFNQAGTKSTAKFAGVVPSPALSDWKIQ